MLSLSEKNTSYNIILYHFGDMFISGRMHYKGSTGANWVLLCRWPLGNIHEHAYLWFMEARTTTLKNIWLFQSRKVCVHWQSNSLQLRSCKRSPVIEANTLPSVYTLNSQLFFCTIDIWLWRMRKCIMFPRSCPIHIASTGTYVYTSLFHPHTKEKPGVASKQADPAVKPRESNMMFIKNGNGRFGSKYPYKFTNILQYVHPNLQQINQKKKMKIVVHQNPTYQQLLGFDPHPSICLHFCWSSFHCFLCCHKATTITKVLQPCVAELTGSTEGSLKVCFTVLR